jgi:hypothetical protein
MRAKAKRRNKRQPLGRCAAMVIAAAGVAAGGFLAGFLPTADSGGHVTSGGPASCIVYRVTP